MESFKGSHKYRRLRGSDIRIVKFKPCPTDSDNDVRIEGYISHVPLQNSDFFALSYVWGDARDTMTITLDGQDFPITTNLWAAIMSLRSRYDPERKQHDENVPELWNETIDGNSDDWKEHAICWWIDAICIDQTDTKERSRQVPRMRQLYSTATRVVVWWGDEWGDAAYRKSQLDVNLLFQAAEKLHDAAPWSTSPCQFSDTSQETRMRLLFETLDAPETLIGPLVFVNRAGWDWMNRVWTLQEAVLPRQDPALIMGLKVTGLWTLMELQECVAAASLQGRFQGHLIEGDQQAPITSILYNMYMLSLKISRRPMGFRSVALSVRAKIFGGLSNWAFSLRAKLSFSERQSAGLSQSLIHFGEELLDRLCSFSEREATIPHDRIYGLLGLVGVPHLPTYLQPDYNRSFAEVCFAYVKFFIKASNTLHVLSLGTSRFEGYPSWVSDFSESHLLDGETRATLVVPVFSRDERCISVPGVRLGEIVAVYHIHEGYYGDLEDNPRDVLGMFLEFARKIMIPASRIRVCDVQLILEEWARLSTACSAFGARASDILTLSEYIGQEPPSKWHPEALASVSALRKYFRVTTHVLLNNGVICYWSNGSFMVHVRKPNKVGDFVYELKGTTLPTLLCARNQGNGFEVTGTCHLLTPEHQHFTEEYFQQRQLETINLY
ncbi:heterokaryon incompatibility protein-domain-containing protein [Cadophora sp. MPI-SDFR-AT-0126]|nr:heterokaryon incompatibility protein-domain-containing protein [Leotiomycetes sp. MPI-SDFR-AT-0126]